MFSAIGVVASPNLFSNSGGGMRRVAFSKLLAVTAGYAAPVALLLKKLTNSSVVVARYKKVNGTLVAVRTANPVDAIVLGSGCIT
jgi:hypothetical protein